jgi:GNAT superfamily N-acetyltransferase
VVVQAAVSGVAVATQGPVVRKAEPEDIPAIVAIHNAAFPEFFLTRMGDAFLTATYQAMLDYPRCIAFIATDTSQTALGFVIGVADPQKYSTHYRRRKKILLPLIVKAALRSPKLISRIWLHVRNKAKTLGGADDIELLSLASTSSGDGVGKALIRPFLKAARQSGCSGVYLDTDAKNNENVHRFYRDRGFHLEHCYRSGRREMSRYRISLEP